MIKKYEGKTNGICLYKLIIKFNNYFAGVGQQIVYNINSESNNCTINFEEEYCHKTIKVLAEKNINAAASHDEISIKNLILVR